MSKSLFYFEHPSTMIIAGPTRSGKTCFLIRILKHFMIQPFPNRIIWFYKEMQPLYESVLKFLPNVEFVHNLNLDCLDSIRSNEKNLVIIDDLMKSAADSKEISNIFTEESHHRNLSVILIVQNLFVQGKAMRNISLNAHYFVLYKNPRDKLQINYLSRQIFPENPKFLVNAFTKATEKPHSYLILDLHPETEERFRILSNIFPEEQLLFYVQQKV